MVSGWGWGVGYLGGLGCLALALVGFVQTDTPLFGVGKEEAAHIRATAPMVALWYLAFMLPFVFLTPDAPGRGHPPATALRIGLATLARTLREARAQPELVATVGTIEALPGAINVIPGEVRFMLDIRSPSDDVRVAAVAAIRTELSAIAARRNVSLALTPLQEQRATACAPRLVTLIEQAIRTEGFPVRRLPSGAGHDGMAMSALTDIAMLFIRCRGGISHHPTETMTAEDAEMALQHGDSIKQFQADRPSLAEREHWEYLVSKICAGSCRRMIACRPR